jgi:hypothetical protein
MFCPNLKHCGLGEGVESTKGAKGRVLAGSQYEGSNQCGGLIKDIMIEIIGTWLWSVCACGR